jgi:rhamnose transport system ATP-binding protein
VARAVFGVDPYESGSVTVLGKTLQKRSPSAAMRSGIALVPEDRRKQGLVIDATVSSNITDAIRGTLTKLGLITTRAENSEAQVWARKLEVKTNALDAVAGTLSGGNQQKVVLAKWLAANPKILIIDEPTRGIDVGTKAEVHRMMSELAGIGLAILMISSELPEVLGMADRVLVMHEGRITADIPRAEATPESVMFAATHQSEDVA